MDQLPQELLDIICSHLRSQKQVGASRLVSKSFAYAGEKYLLQTIYVCFSPLSWYRLHETISNPKFNKYITTLVYHPTRLKGRDHETWYKERLDHYYGELVPKPPWEVVLGRDGLPTERSSRFLLRNRRTFDADVERRWGKAYFDRIWASYQAWRAWEKSLNNDSASLLALNLPRVRTMCPNLKHISITREPLTGYKHTHANKISEMVGKRKDLKRHDATQCFVNSSDKKWKSMTMQDISHRLLTSKVQFIERMRTRFANLRSLRLSFDYKSAAASEHRMPHYKPSRALSYATELSELKIMAVGHKQTFLHLEDVVGDNCWTKLKSFGLVNFNAPASGLIEFVLKHRAKLGTLILRDGSLYQGNWDDVLRSLAGNLPCITKVRLHGTLSSIDQGLEYECGMTMSPTKRAVALILEMQVYLKVSVRSHMSPERMEMRKSWPLILLAGTMSIVTSSICTLIQGATDEINHEFCSEVLIRET